MASKSPEHRRRIRRTAAEPRLLRDFFPKFDLNTALQLTVPKQRKSRPHREISLIGRERGAVAAQAYALFLGFRKDQFIGETYGLHARAQQVIAVFSLSQDFQAQVNLCEGPRADTLSSCLHCPSPICIFCFAPSFVFCIQNFSAV